MFIFRRSVVVVKYFPNCRAGSGVVQTDFVYKFESGKFPAFDHSNEGH